MSKAIEAITCFCERQRWLASYGQSLLSNQSMSDQKEPLMGLDIENELVVGFRWCRIGYRLEVERARLEI